MRTRTFIILAVIVVVAGLVVHYISKEGFSTSPYTEFVSNVTAVIDGDTIQLASGDRVRLLGINAPEKGQPKYSDAKALLASLVLNRTIKVESDIDKKDRYGRLLGYVFIEGLFVNKKILEDGLAVSWFIDPNYRYKEELEAAEAQAKEEGAGLWNLEAGSCLSVIELHYNAEGNDNENLNDEYAVFGNVCDKDFPLSGWKVKDSANKVYAFPAINLATGSNLILHTGKGQNNRTDLFWGSGVPIWNNAGDVLYLQDPSGGIALDYPYP